MTRDKNGGAHMPPMPYMLELSSTFTNNGKCHLYLVDATGKKIAALWGTEDTKHALGNWILACAARTKGEE